MDPPPILSRVGRACFPRTRGDGPFTSPGTIAASTFPPHARGWTRRNANVRIRAAVSPARAGMDPTAYYPSSDAAGFPRTRGDGPVLKTHKVAGVAFPPHARGWTRHGHPQRPSARVSPHARGWTEPTLTDPHNWWVSPARAGMDLCRVARGLRSCRFPRTRGDGPPCLNSEPSRASFPRTRGDGPEETQTCEYGQQFPPHARGWTPVWR